MDTQKQDATMSPGEWALTLFLINLPFIGLILLLVWAFGGGTDPNKANFAKGALLLAVIIFVLFGVVMLIFGSALIALIATTNQ